MAIATSALLAAGIGAAGTIGSSVVGGLSAAAARGAQEKQAAAALEEQRRQFELARQDLAPFRGAAERATSELEKLTVSGNPAEVAARQQGQEQIRRALAAQGLLRSSSQADALTGLEVGLEGNRRNILAALAGSSAPAQSAQLAANQGIGASGILTGLGQAQGQAALQIGSSISQGIQGVSNAAQLPFQQKLQQDQFQQYLNALSGASNVNALAGIGSIPSIDPSARSAFGVAPTMFGPR